MAIEQFNKILNQKESRNKVLEGINLATDLVAPTLGHSSRRILVDAEYGDIEACDDGTTILKKINPEDTQVGLGVKVVREASAKTDLDEGDGTTTTAVILRGLVKELLKDNSKEEQVFNPKSGNNLKLRKEIKEGLKKVIEYIDKSKIEVTNNEQIALIGKVSANDENIGNILADIFSKLGKDGVVNVEEGKKVETTYEIIKGMSLGQGWLAPQFVTNPEREEAILEDDVNVLISSKKLQDIDEIKQIANLRVNNLFIIAEDVSGVFLNTLIANKLMGAIRVVAIKAPSFGNIKDLLTDIAIATGATIIGEDVKINELKKEHLGRADKIVVNRSRTIIIGFGGDKNKIDERTSQLSNRLENESSEYEIEKLRERISKLQSGVGSIKVGGNTPLEIKNKKTKIDDAVAAVKSALKGGIVSGGGVSLLQASQVLNKDGGEGILKRAIQKPFIQILENSDVYEEDIDKRIADSSGYNTETEEYGDMIKMGIVDPANVVKASVSNAVSSALMVSNLGGAVSLIRKKDKESNE